MRRQEVRPPGVAFSLLSLCWRSIGSNDTAGPRTLSFRAVLGIMTLRMSLSKSNRIIWNVDTIGNTGKWGNIDLEAFHGPAVVLEASLGET